MQVIALSGSGLAQDELLDGAIRVTRLALDRRITSAMRPLPSGVRRAVARLVGMDADATILPASRVSGLDRLRYPIRRFLEVASHVRRVGPWTDALVRAAPDTDVFHTEALSALPVIRRAARRVGGRFVYDFADYQTEGARMARLPRPVRVLLRRRERRWAREAAGILAVSEPMADLVAARLGIARPGVLLNCQPRWRPDEPTPVVRPRIRDALGLPPNRPIVLYHGQFKPSRGIEELLRAADDPQLSALDPAIVLLGFGRLRPTLDEAAGRNPNRIYVLPAVPPDELLDWVAGADVAYVGFPAVTLNLRLTIPNKVFESMMAGVPLVAALGTATARFVDHEKIGRCMDVNDAKQPAGAIAELLTMPDPERLALRRHCRQIALTRYSWEERAQPLLELYRRL